MHMRGIGSRAQSRGMQGRHARRCVGTPPRRQPPPPAPGLTRPCQLAAVLQEAAKGGQPRAWSHHHHRHRRVGRQLEGGVPQEDGNAVAPLCCCKPAGRDALVLAACGQGWGGASERQGMAIGGRRAAGRSANACPKMPAWPSTAHRRGPNLPPSTTRTSPVGMRSLTTAHVM